MMRGRSKRALIRVLAAFVMALLGSTGFAAARQQAPADTAPQPARAIEREQRFLEGLRQRGYFDLALAYTEEQLNRTDLPEPLRAIFSFEQGRGILEEATSMADLERRQALLDQARAKLEDFTQKFPNDDLAPEALVQLARLQVERGHTALLQANEIKLEDDQGKPVPGAKAAREARLAAARSSFGEARKAYETAHTQLQANLDKYPKFINEADPRRRARDLAHVALMNEELQRAVVEYEDAQTLPPDDKERAALLADAAKRFEDLFNRYRTQLAGLHARMLQGKSLEEQGDLNQAMGLYDELMGHSDPQLLPLQRKVGYFRIIILGKRNQHALAADEAARWLTQFRNYRTTDEGLGVQLELARNLLAQLPTIESETEKAQASKRAIEALTNVVRFYSPHKPEALALLLKYQPRSARRLNQIASLSYDDAMAQADGAISSQDWNQAEQLFKHAIRKAEQANDTDKLNRARFFLAYVYYASNRFYESIAVGEHLARRYPQGGLSARAGELAIASMTQAYNTFTQVDRQSDLDRLNDMGAYVVKTWPDTEQADNARSTLGEIALGRGEYAEASNWFEQIRTDSPKHLDALVKAGDAHWRLSRKLAEGGGSAEAEKEAKTALDLIEGALKAREAANVPLTDPGRLANMNALAELHRSSGRATEAIALLSPLVKAVEGVSPAPELVPLYSTSLSILLRSYLGNGEPARATEVMASLERISPSKAALTQLYFELGRTLKAELEDPATDHKSASYKKTLEAYKQFLLALAGSQVGQSFDSLLWAGEAMLDMHMPSEATELLDRVVKTYASDENFLKQQDSQTRLLRGRLKLITALRQSGNTAHARELADDLLKIHKNVLELIMEKGLVIEDQARDARPAADKSRLWQESLAYWQKLAQQLRNSTQRKKEGYEAWYHVAVAQEGLGKKNAALGTLKGILTLNPSLGSPEMKQKYEDMIKRLGK